MRNRIMNNKLILAYYLRFGCEGHLAAEVYSEQLRKGLPGLSGEVATICEELGIKT